MNVDVLLGLGVVVALLLALRPSYRFQRAAHTADDIAAAAERKASWAEQEKALIHRVNELEDQVNALNSLLAQQAREFAEFRKGAVINERKLFIAEYRIRDLEAEKAAREGKTPAYKPKKLTAEQRKALQDAMLDCFPMREDWQMLLGFIGRDLDTVTVGDNLKSISATAIAKANNEGWIVQLITQAATERLGVPAFQALVGSLLRALEI
jgi:hypothetical protein